MPKLEKKTENEVVNSSLSKKEDYTQKKIKRLNIDLDEDLHKKLKRFTAENSMTVKQFIIAAINSNRDFQNFK